MKLGPFLREKVTNMYVWLKSEGLCMTLPEFSNTHVVLMAQTLHDEYADAITAQEFEPLLQLEQVDEVVRFVRERPHLHNKFWRYLSLFSDSVSVHE